MPGILKTWMRQRALLATSLVTILCPVLTAGASDTLPFENARTEVLNYFEQQLENDSLGHAAWPLAAFALVSGRADLVDRFIKRDRVRPHHLWSIWDYSRCHSSQRDVELLLELCVQRFPDRGWHQGACLTLGEIGRLDYALILADAIECKSDRRRTLSEVARLRLVFHRDVAGARRAYMNRDIDTTEADFSKFCQRESRKFNHDRSSAARQAVGLSMSNCWRILVDEPVFLAFLVKHREIAMKRDQENRSGQEVDDDDGEDVEHIIAASILGAIRAANTGDFEQARRHGSEIDEMFDRNEVPESIRDARWFRGGRAYLAMLGRDRDFLRRHLEPEVGEGSLLQYQTEALLMASIDVGLLDEVIHYLNTNVGDAPHLADGPVVALLLSFLQGDGPFLMGYTEDIGVSWLRQAGSFERFREQLDRLRDERLRMQILCFVLLSGEHHVVGPAFE